MRYVVHQPSAALAPFVQSMWLFEAELAHARERVLPNGRMQLLVNLDEDELRAWRGDGLDRLQTVSGAALTSVSDEPFAIDTAEQRRIVGATFHPGGAAAFFDVPMTELGGRDVALGDLWGRSGAILRDRMLEARDDQACLAVLERALVGRLHRHRDRQMDLAIVALERGRPVGEVARTLELSPRRLIRRFSARVGLAPKRFARLRRFHRVLQDIAGARRVDWADVATAAGYYDQAHLIRDFRAFSGLKPSDYEPRNARDETHLVLD